MTSNKIRFTGQARKTNRLCSTGFSYAEVLVSMVLLTTIMSLVTTSSLRISKIWKDIQHQKVATCELLNQLEHLSVLSPEEATSRIDKLAASDFCRRVLIQPELKGAIALEPDLGHRITLSIDWKRHRGFDGSPVTLTGWLIEGRRRAAIAAEDGE